jgi:uncharacterized membrane protein YqhA
MICHLFTGFSMRKIFEKATLIIWLPVTVLLVSSILTAVYGTYQFVLLVIYGFTGETFQNSKIVITKLLSIIDIYLLVIIQLIFSMGLYELFIGPLETPEWLKITTIDQLKAALASVIALFLAIFFAHLVVEVQNIEDLAYGGIGIASVIGALVFYYKVKTS